MKTQNKHQIKPETQSCQTSVSGSVISPNDIRIGNLVTDEFYDKFKTIIEVESIDKKGINLIIMDDDNQFPVLSSVWIAPNYYFSSLRGIPITREILLNYGFKQCENEYWFEKDLFAISIIGVVNLQVKGCNEVNLDSKKIQYLHELQNIYFSLTSKELNNG